MPQIFGGTSAYTYLWTSDASITSNIAVFGGQSSESSITTQTTGNYYPLFLALDIVTSEILWAKTQDYSISPYMESVQSIRLDQSATKVLVCFSNYYNDIYFQYFNAASGSLIQTFSICCYNYSPGDKSILVSSSDVLYMINQLDMGYQHFAAINILTLTTQWENIQCFEAQYTYQTVFYGTSIISLGGSYDYDYYGTLSRIDSTGTYQAFLYHFDIYCSITRIYADQSTGNFHLCDSNKHFYLTDSFFSIIGITSLPFSIYCNSVYGSGSTSYFSFFDSIYGYIVSIDWNSLQYKQHKINIGLDYGYIQSMTISLDSSNLPRAIYIGYLYSIYSDDMSQIYFFNYAQAFINTYNFQQSCLTSDTSTISSGTISVFSNSFNSYLGVFPITSYPLFLTSYPSATAIPITLVKEVLSWCSPVLPSGALSASTIPNQTYNLTASALSFQIPAFTYSETCSDIIFTYSGISLPSLVTISASGLVTIVSSSFSDIGTFTITVQGEINDLTTASTTFTLTVIPDFACITATLSFTSVSSQTYNICDPSLSITVPVMASTVSSSYCGTISYVVTNDGLTSLEAGLFSFNSATMILSVSTFLASYAGIHTVSVVGHQGTFTSHVSTLVITIVVVDQCSTALLLTTPVSDQTYNINDSALSIAIASFTSDISVCGSFFYSAKSDGLTTLSSLFAFNNSTLILSVSSTAVSDAGLHIVTITGYQGTSTTHTVTLTFNVNVVDLCIYASITAPTLTGVAYNLNSGAQVFPLTAFSSNMSSCGLFNYSATNDGTTSLDAGIFSFNSVGLLLTVSTTSTSYVGLHTVYIAAYQGIYTSNGATATIEITVADLCASAILSSVSYPTYTLNLADPAVMIPLTQFTSTQSTCGAFAYTSTSDGLTSLDTAYFSFDSVAFTLSLLQTTNTAFVGSHYVTIQGQQGTYSSQGITVTIQIEVIDLCVYASLSSTSYADQTYYLHDLTLSIPLTAFTSNVSSTYCGAFVYSAISDGLTSLDTVLFSFTPMTLLTVISTTITSYVGLHTVTISGCQGTYTSKTISVTININIIDLCLTALLSSPSYPSSTYNLHDPTLSISITPFTSNVSSSYCGSFVYTPMSDGLPTLDTTLFSFSSTTMILSVLSTVNTLSTGTHLITIQGQQSTYSTQMISVQIQVIIQDLCLTAQLTAPLYSNQTYSLYDPILSILLTSFSSNVSSTYCGAFAYSLISDGLSTLDSNTFTFDPLLLILKVYSTNTSLSGNHTVTIYGYQGTYTTRNVSTVIYISITDKCMQASVVVVNPGFQTYGLFRSQLIVTFPPFAVTPSFCGSLSYTSSLSDGRSLDSKLIYFDSSNYLFKIQSSDISKIGLYYIMVNASFSNPLYPTTAFTFTLQVDCFITSFSITNIIQSQKFLIGGSSLKIPFNNFVQAPSCQFPVEYTATLGNGADLPGYIAFSGSDRTFIISTSDLTLKDQTVSVKLTGSINDASSHSVSQVFQVSFSAPASTTTDSQNVTSLSDDSTDSFGAGISSGVFSVEKSSKSRSQFKGIKNITQTLTSGQVAPTGYISSISNKGVVTLKFTQIMTVPENYSEIDSAVLRVKYSYSDEKNASLVGWNCTSFEESAMTIQLQFDNPLEVSSSYTLDVLQIVFIDNSWFQTSKDGLFIPYLTSTQKQIPGQVQNSSNLSTSSDQVRCRQWSRWGEVSSHPAMSSFRVIWPSNSSCMLFLVFNVARSASLSQLWGMINALQIITCLPGFSLLFPSNAQFLLSMITSIANFDMINPSQLLDKYMTTEPTQAEEVPSNLQNIGFSTTNIIKNMGMVFGAVVIVLILSIVDLILKKLSQRYPSCTLLTKIYLKLHKMVYYSMLLRPLIESYLNACIGAFIALYYMDFSTKLNAAESILACIMSVLFSVFPFVTLFFLKSYKFLLRRVSFRTKFDSLYEGLKLGSDAALGAYQVPFFLFRRLLMAITIVCIQDFIVLQLLIQSFVSLLYLRFLVEYRPYETKKMNGIEIFNELTISACFYVSYLFTEYVPESKRRYFVGWLLIFMVLMNLFVNFMGILTSTGELLLSLYRSWRKKQVMKGNKVLPFKKIDADISSSTLDIFNTSVQHNQSVTMEPHSSDLKIEMNSSSIELQTMSRGMELNIKAAQQPNLIDQRNYIDNRRFYAPSKMKT